jgi:hypothetical protein
MELSTQIVALTLLKKVIKAKTGQEPNDQRIEEILAHIWEAFTDGNSPFYNLFAHNA